MMEMRPHLVPVGAQAFYLEETQLFFDDEAKEKIDLGKRVLSSINLWSGTVTTGRI